ncbi:ribonuclease H-like domain-containing protein [Tanacetum coccineum]
MIALCEKCDNQHTSPHEASQILNQGPTDVAFYLVVEIEDSGSLGFSFDRSMNFWNFGRDILRDILGRNSLHKNGNSKKRISTGKDGIVRILSPVNATEIQVVEKERKAKNVLLMAIPKEHMRRFHGMDDAKEIWEAIRTRFGGNANSKKMQKAVFKQQFEAFKISNSEGLEKRYDRFQQLLSQLEAHEDWDLLHEDLEQIDDVDIEEMDINWQIAMIAIRMKKFYKKTGRRGEHTEVEETNHALMAINSSSKVSLCSKTCIDSYNTLKTLCDEQMNQLGDQEAQILAYSQAVKKLEAQLRLINSGISLNSKVGLGFEIQSNNEVLSYEEEMNFSVFNCSKEDSVGKPLYSRFTKTNDFKGVPHPLSGDYTPTPQEEIDESLYVYGKKGPQEPEPNVSDDRSSEYSTCQSNDSAGSIGTSSEHSVDPESEISSVPPEVYVSTPITSNEKGVSDPKSKEVEPSCVSHIKTPRQPIKDQATPKVNRKNWNAMMERELGEGYSFTKKKCFVCGSLSYLIKDCDYYEKKMAREAEVKKQRVCNTGIMMEKPVWTNANRVNHANQFVPKPVQVNGGRPNANSVKPNVNTRRVNVNSVRSNVNTGRTNVNPVRPTFNTSSSNVNTVRSRQPIPTKTSNSFSPKRPQDHPLKNMVDRGIFDSGCSGHMTGNKDQLEDFEEFNGGSVTFGGSKGYISGKGKIRVGNLDFDSVSFVKELGHFNLFSISQICDKQHKVLFTETECLVVSSDFKMPDENQILLKVPRHHNMYSFDMKTPTPAKGFACLIAKATSDESKLWHRRLGHINFKNLNKLVKGNLVRGTRKNGINHEYSNARTPQQNRVAERMNRTLIEAARTMLADSLLPTTFWAEVVTLEKSIDIPHAGASEVTNSAGTSQTLIFNASEEKDEDVELIVVPSTVRNTEEKAESRKSSTNSKKEEILTELQQEKKASSTNTSEDNPKILAFRRELEEIALKHLGKVSENTITSTPSVNTGSFDVDDSPMPELEIFHKSEDRNFLLRHLMMRGEGGDIYSFHLYIESPVGIY